MRPLLGSCVVLSAIGLVGSLEAPPVFTVDLSKPPGRRWEGVIATVLARHPYTYSFLPVFTDHNATLFSKLQPAQWHALGRAVRRHWPEAAEELGGIATQFVAAGLPEVSFEYLVGWLYFHELAHTDLVVPATGLALAPPLPTECTGILVQASDGTVLHGGNMDQSPLAVRNLTLRVRFADGSGQTVFEGVDWYAVLTTGVSRAVRKGFASVQENWRGAAGNPRPLADVLADVEDGVVSQMLVFRHEMVAAHTAASVGATRSFSDFIRSVHDVRLAAPFFIVAGGPNRGEGVVIARNLTVADGVARLSRPQTKTDPNDYFLVQANTDRWLPEDANDPRRTAAELTLRSLGLHEGPTLLGLMAVTSTYPVHNPHTAYTALMSAATGELHAYVREALCPVNPAASVVRDIRYCQPNVTDATNSSAAPSTPEPTSTLATLMM